MSNNCVMFKGKKNRIEIILDEKTDLSVIKKTLKSKLESSKSFFQDTNATVTFEGRSLTQEEENSLLFILNESANMNLSYGNSNNTAENHIKLDELLENETISKIYTGAVRNGQVLSYEGTLIIIGDVNPGGVVEATENIIVLGSLKGIAYAGIKGNCNAIIAACNMCPTQIRINDIIASFPARLTKENPEYAYIKNENICIMPLV